MMIDDAFSSTSRRLRPANAFAGWWGRVCPLSLVASLILTTAVGCTGQTTVDASGGDTGKSGLNPNSPVGKRSVPTDLKGLKGKK